MLFSEVSTGLDDPDDPDADVISDPEELLEGAESILGRKPTDTTRANHPETGQGGKKWTDTSYKECVCVT